LRGAERIVFIAMGQSRNRAGIIRRLVSGKVPPPFQPPLKQQWFLLRVRVQKRSILTDGIQGCSRLLCETSGRNGSRQNEGTPRFGCLQLTHLRETFLVVFRVPSVVSEHL